MLLQANNINKTFGNFVANKNINIAIKKGEIHALLGENGAGKSTLVKILFGSLQPDYTSKAETIKWKGEQVRITSPFMARKLGIGMVFQHFSLFESLSVAENIALSFDSGEKLNRISEEAREISKRYNLPIEPTALVGDLSVGERQRIEIIRCLMQNPELIILDEPTSVLTPQEAEGLFETLERLAQEGCAILYISHRLEEVKRLCSVATILRHGEVVEECDPKNESARSLAAKMVGENIADVVPREHEKEQGQSLLRVNGLSRMAEQPFGVSLNDINVDIKEGEILGIAGIAGNGQGELFECLSGEALQNNIDEVVMCGQEVGHRDISGRRKLNVAFICEERLGHAVAPQFNLTQNLFLTRHESDKSKFCKGGMFNFIDSKTLGEITEKICEEMDVRKADKNPVAASLSGGNLQKFIMGRELDRKPKVLVINQPTWGVDAGAATLIRQKIIDLANEGSAVLVISQDLDEIFTIATRIAVMNNGYLSNAIDAQQCSREDIGLKMMEKRI